MRAKFLAQLSAASVLVFAVLGCASVEPPTKLLTEAESDIKSAQEMGAEQHAPLVMRSAESNLAAAKKAIKEEEYEQATYALEKSIADTELAVATTQAQKLESAVEQVEENLNALEQALNK